jgi:hypothetical protein
MLIFFGHKHNDILHGSQWHNSLSSEKIQCTKRLYLAASIIPEELADLSLKLQNKIRYTDCKKTGNVEHISVVSEDWGLEF